MQAPAEFFISPSKGQLEFPEVIREISSFIEADPESRYKLIVGSDSAVDDMTDFVSVIVMHRIGKCARYFWIRKREKTMPSLRQRIYHEALLSLALAERLSREVGEKINGYLSDGTCQLEIHVDIGQFGPTRDMIKEIVGMILGSGYVVKIKPESYAASSVADKHV
jgi:uncharacterized protein